MTHARRRSRHDEGVSNALWIRPSSGVVTPRIRLWSLRANAFYVPSHAQESNRTGSGRGNRNLRYGLYYPDLMQFLHAADVFSHSLCLSPFFGNAISAHAVRVSTLCASVRILPEFCRNDQGVGRAGFCWKRLPGNPARNPNDGRTRTFIRN